MPARWVFLDEVDAYPGDVHGEGDPIALAEARTISFGHRSKLFLASTPTIKGVSRIEREYEASDQQRYHVPCPHCGTLDDHTYLANYHRWKCKGCKKQFTVKVGTILRTHHSNSNRGWLECG